jgi:hypothetical protein
MCAGNVTLCLTIFQSLLILSYQVFEDYQTAKRYKLVLPFGAA